MIIDPWKNSGVVKKTTAAGFHGSSVEVRKGRVQKAHKTVISFISNTTAAARKHGISGRKPRPKR